MKPLESFCLTAQQEGLSARSALRIWRAWGEQVRTDTFMRQWRAVKAGRKLRLRTERSA